MRWKTVVAVAMLLLVWSSPSVMARPPDPSTLRFRYAANLGAYSDVTPTWTPAGYVAPLGHFTFETMHQGFTIQVDDLGVLPGSASTSYVPVSLYVQGSGQPLCLVVGATHFVEAPLGAEVTAFVLVGDHPSCPGRGTAGTVTIRR